MAFYKYVSVLIISIFFSSLQAITVTNKSNQEVIVRLSYPIWKYASKQPVYPNQTINITDIPYFSQVEVMDDLYEQQLAKGFVNPADKTITSKTASVIIEKSSDDNIQVKIQ